MIDDWPVDGQIHKLFHTFDSNDPSASVAIAAFVLADIKIYKDGGVAQRTSTSGVVLLDTDGIDFDGNVGIGGFSVDLSDNTQAGFYAAGSSYSIVIGPVTVDAAVINFVAYEFTIERTGGVLALLKGTNSLANIEDKIDIIDINVDQIETAVITNAAGVDISADIAVIEGQTDDIGVAGAGLTAINLPNQTMDITGNLSGSVGSVTGAVGSVAGNVDGAVGSVTATVNADMVAISTDATAANNLELQYDGTGYTDDTAPASRSQVENISVVGAAVHISARAAPNGFTVTTGTEVNDEDSTVALDGAKHELSHAAGTLDALYKFDIGGDAAPVSVTFTGNFNGNNDSFNIFGNTGTDGIPVWVQIGTIAGVNSSANTVHTFTMFANMIVSDVAGEVQIRIQNTGLTSSSFDVDQVFVSKTNTSRSVGYADGAVWIDGGSNSSTESFVDGVADNPVDTIANARTLADNVGLKVFHTLPEVSNTLAQTFNAYEFMGIGWILALGGQNINNCHIFNARVSGIGTGADLMGFHGCVFATASIQKARLTNCSFTATVTHTLAGNYRYIDCQSGVPGSGAPTFAKTPGQAVMVEYRRWSGSITFSGLQVGDVMTVGGEMGTIDLGSPTGTAAVEIRGTYKEIINVGSAVVNMTGAILGGDVASILTDTNELQTDWVNGGRLDLLLDAIPTTAMRGTDGANTVVPDAAGVVPTAIENADALLTRDWTAVGTTAVRSVLNALRFLRNKWSITGTTLTVTEEDDTAPAWTATVSVDAAADPVIGSDPV